MDGLTIASSWDCNFVGKTTIAERIWTVVTFESPIATFVARFVAYIFYVALAFPWLMDMGITVKNRCFAKALPPLPLEIAGMDTSKLKAKMMEKEHLAAGLFKEIEDKKGAPYEMLWVTSEYGNIDNFNAFGVMSKDSVYSVKDEDNKDYFMSAFMCYKNVDDIEISLPSSYGTFVHNILEKIHAFVEDPRYKETVSKNGFVMIANRNKASKLSIYFLMNNAFVAKRNYFQAVEDRRKRLQRFVSE